MPTYRIQIPKGWKTTEFWVTHAYILGVCFEAAQKVVPPIVAAKCAALAACAYTISRGLAKLVGGSILTDSPAGSDASASPSSEAGSSAPVAPSSNAG